MRRLRWSMAAANDLESIADYLYLHHPSFAASTIGRLHDATKSLKANPYMGRPGMKSGTRELVVAPLPYLLVYAVDNHAILILRFLHAAQERS